MKTRLTESQISQLKASYQNLTSMPVAKANKFLRMFDGMNSEVLNQLVAANINFVSSTAKTRLLRS